jgi:Ni/Co efflux regulator RcnB
MLRRFASILIIAVALVSFTASSSLAQDKNMHKKNSYKKEHVMKKSHKSKKHKVVKHAHKSRKKVKVEKEDSRIKVN